MPTIGDLCVSSLKEIRVARAGDVVSPDTMATTLYLLNRLLDLWNADDRAVYNSGFADLTLTPSLSPHTIGPGGTFAVTQRPKDLLFASVNLGGAPAAFVTINVRDAAWYANQPVPGLSMAFPTDVYYQPEWPLGKLYFFGVPSSAYGVRLWTRGLLAAVVQADDFSLPNGYQAALELTLAEVIAPSFGQSVSESTARMARQARALIFGDNDEVPRISTQDAGMPGNGGSGSFNWLTRRSA